MKTKESIILRFTLTLVVASLLPLPAPAQPYTFTTFAGNAPHGALDGLSDTARFYNPTSVAVDQSNNVYVADFQNGTIRKITSGGVVSTFAGLAGTNGSADGAGHNARFYNATGVASDNKGNLFVADFLNHTIRKITPAAEVSTFAGLPGVPGTNNGTGNAARFNGPYGLAVDGSNNIIVAEAFSHTIRKISSAAAVSTLAGLAGTTGTNDGTGSAARFNTPTHVTVDGAGNLFVADYFNNTIRKITPAAVVSTFAGTGGAIGSADGTGNAARFNNPVSVALDAATNVYVADYGNHTIRKITPARVVSTLAGMAGMVGSTDGTSNVARFYSPNGVAVDVATNIYVADNGNSVIRKVTSGGVVSTFAGLAGGFGTNDGAGGYAKFNIPNSVALDSSNNVFVADEGNNTIRKITPEGTVSTFAGLAGTVGTANGAGSAARFNRPEGLALDSTNYVYVADQFNHTIRKITPAGLVSTFAGLAGSAGSANGTGSTARFNNPSDVTVDSSGNVYVADYGNHTIRKITPAAVVSTFAGAVGMTGSTDGTGGAARFNSPYCVAVDGTGNVYVADTGNQTIRKITPTQVVTTIAGAVGMVGSADGTSTGARFNFPNGVTVDTSGNVFVADSSNHTLRKITPGGVVTTVGGLAATAGTADGTGDAARFNSPFDVTVDGGGTLYVADSYNHTIRRGFATASLPPVLLRSSGRTAGQFAFAMTGMTNLTVDIQTTSDLANWQFISAYALVGGTNYFVGTLASESNRLFRARLR